MGESVPPRLPNEIVRLILSELTSCHLGTLASCALVSKRFRRIATPILWRWFRLSPDAEVEMSINQYRYQWKPDLLQDIRVLSIDHNRYSWCNSEHFKQIVAPNLRTLILDSPGFSSPYDRYHLHARIPFPPDSREMCSLVNKLRPRTVIIKEMGLSYAELMPTQIDEEVWMSVETLIFTISSREARLRDWYEGGGFTSYANVKRIYWIYDPTLEDPGTDWYSVTHRDRHTEGRFDFAYIGTVAEIRDHRFNIGSVDVDNNDGPTDNEAAMKMQKRLEDQFRQDMRELCEECAEDEYFEIKGEEAIKKRLDTIRFITLEEFIDKENWFDWSDPEELRSWKKAMDGRMGVVESD